MADPVVYGPGYSSYVRTARVALEEKGVAYRLEEFDFIQGGMPDEHLKRQPFGKVPAFEHDGFALYETGAITRYVDEAFPGPALQPDNARDRARMTQIISLLDSYTYAPTVGSLVIQRLVVPMVGGEPDEAMIAEALPKVDKSMQVLEGLLGSQSFFVNDTLSLADVHLIPIYAYFSMTPESAAILENTPGLRRWWDGISARASVAATQPQLG